MTQRATWTRTARGIEMEHPLPGLVRRTLAWGAACLGLFALAATLATGEWRAPLWIAGFFLDRTVLLIGLPLLAALLWLDRGSRERVIAGGSAWVYETRIGPLVAARRVEPAPPANAIETRGAPHGRWQVVVASAAPLPTAAVLADGLDESDARTLADALREGVQSPRATLPVKPGPLHQEWPRIVIGMLGNRIATAIPIAVAGFGALLLASAWNLRSAQLEPVAVYDAQAAGELLRYRFRVREPDAEEHGLGWREGVARFELGVRWRTPDGTARESWWVSGEEAMLSYMAGSRLEQVAQLIGVPHVELALPASTRPLLGPTDAAPSLAHLPDTAPPGLEAAHALIGPLEDVLSLLAVQGGAAAADWSIAYRGDDPAQATLAALARIEAEALTKMPAGLLVATALAGVLLLAGGIGVAFDRRGLGRLFALALLPAVPWWAPYAQGVAAWTGIEPGTERLLRDLALRASSDQANEASFQLLPASRPPDATDAIVLRWDPVALPASSMLGVLGLDRDLPTQGTFDQRRDALIERGAARIAALDDAALVDLIQRWHADEFGRYAPLRVPWVEGLCRARTQATRSATTLRWIEYGLHNPQICVDS